MEQGAESKQHCSFGFYGDKSGKCDKQNRSVIDSLMTNRSTALFFCSSSIVVCFAQLSINMQGRLRVAAHIRTAAACSQQEAFPALVCMLLSVEGQTPRGQRSKRMRIWKKLVSPAQILDMQMYSVAPLRDNTMHYIPQLVVIWRRFTGEDRQRLIITSDL